MATTLDSSSQKGTEKGIERKRASTSGAESSISVILVGRENIGDALPPHESYEGKHRWDPAATWTPEEEARAVRKTDMYLLTALCIMVGQLDL